MTLPSHALSSIAALVAASALGAQNPTYWTTYFGGSETDAVDQVVAAANGDILIAGTTDSSDLPIPPTAYQPARAGQYDVFVARISADGSRVLAATYLGGTTWDMVYDLAEASDGTVWVAGKSNSADFPTTPDAYSTPNGNHDAFVAQLDAGLTSLQYATLVGGRSSDESRRLVVDDQNQLVYLAGIAGGTFPTTPSAFQSSVVNGAVFVSVLDRSVAGTTTLAYGTTLDGSFLEFHVHGLSVDAAGIVTVTGTTGSSNFPTTADAYDTALGGSADGFVTRIDPSLSGAASLVYSSYFGGSDFVDSMVHTVDAAGIVHLLPISRSPDLPATPNALQGTPGGGLDAFYAQLDPSIAGAGGLLYGSWVVAGVGTEGQGVGNPAGNACAAIAQTADGVAFWVLASPSSAIATTPGAFQPATFVRRGHAMTLDLTGPDPAVSYATSFHGCSQNMFTGALAVRPDGDLLLTGWGDSFPSTPGTPQPQLAAKFDGFVSRLETGAWPSPVKVLGASCPGTVGTPTFSAVAPPRLCKSMTLQATGLPPFRPGAILYGDGSTYLGAPLPIPLAAIGGATCMLHAGPVITLPSGSDAAGVANITSRVPFTVNLLAGPFAVQFLCTDPGANALGLITTNGLELEVRW